MPENSHRFFRNAACAYFPCHAVADDADFNCLFCFCPLYWLEDCGGSPAFKNGIKDCTGCTLPHRPEGYDAVLARLRREFAHRAPRPDPGPNGNPTGAPDKSLDKNRNKGQD